MSVFYDRFFRHDEGRGLKARSTHYCPGCGHGTVHKLLAEVMDALGIRDRTIGIAPVGCAVVAYYYLDCDISEAAHGRAPAVATAIKRCLPDRIVFSYQQRVAPAVLLPAWSSVRAPQRSWACGPVGVAARTARRSEGGGAAHLARRFGQRA